MSHNGLSAPSMISNTTSDTLLESNSHNTVYLKHEIDSARYNEAAEEEERSLLGGFQSSRPRSILRKSIPFFKSPIGIIVALASLLLLLLLSVAASISEDWDAKVRESLSSLQEKVNQGIQRVHDGSPNTCEDPWATPGYIWYGDHRFDARWISYKAFPEDVLRKDASKSIDPEKTGPRPAKEAPHLNQLPMQYTKAFSQKKIRTNNTDLEFLRNKHIVVLGSSLDREATMMFCNAYEGAAPADLKWHHSLRCRFPDYNLTISQWMHFGMAETSYHRGGDKISNEYNFEDRVDRIFTEMAEKDGKPDLLVFTSGFWDLQYLDQHLNKLNHAHPLEKQFPLVRSDQLKWHRARLTQAVQHLRLRFPDSFLMYRTTTEPGKARTVGDEESTAVFQLNQSARIAMKKLKVPLFHWSDLVKGNHEHRDVHHFTTVSRANAVYHEMLFWHLKQLSRPKADTSCWLDR